MRIIQSTRKLAIFYTLKQNLKPLLLLTLCWYSSGAKASSFNKTIEEGQLPPSFVSISEKLPSGKFKHRMGGVLIYPGVILTSTHHMDHLKETFPEYQIKEKNLYVSISTGSKKAVASKVLYIYRHGIFQTQDSPTNDLSKDVTLVFFSTTSETEQINPVPIVTARERDLFMKQTSPPLLRAVGAYSYDPKELKSLKNLLDPHKLSWGEYYKASKKHLKLSLCPKSTKTFIGKAHMRMSPSESSFLSQTILARPGQSYLSEEAETKLSAYSEIMRWNQRSCGMPFCASPYSDYSKNQDTIKYFCSDHFGYPLLWKTPAGEYKIVSLASSTNFDGIFPLDLHTFPEIIGPDIAQYVPWTKEIISRFLKVTKDDYIKNQPPVDDFFKSTLLETMTKALKKSPLHPEFIVNIKAHLSSERSFSCKGTFISKGVILTAAHCLDFSHARKIWGDKIDKEPKIKVFFRKKSKILELNATQISTYRKPRKLRTEYIYGKNGEVLVKEFGEQGTDMALIFFETPDDFPNIKPADLATRKDWKLFLTDPKGSAMWGITTHGLSAEQLKIEDGFHFRMIPLDHYSLGRYWYQRIMKEIHPERLHSFIIPRYEKITGLKFDTQKIIQKFQSPHYHKFKFSLNLCMKKKSICTEINLSEGFLERSHYTCGGASGSPILIRNSAHEAWKAVGVLNSSANLGGANVNGCGFAAESTNITLQHYQDWIHKTIKEHRKSTSTPP